MGYLTRDQAKAEALFEVEIGEHTFACRVPSAMELMAAGVMPVPAVDPKLSAEENKRAMQATSEAVAKSIRSNVEHVDKMLACVMVKPPLWLGPEEACPEDAITPSVFGPYRDQLLTAALPHLSYGEVRRKALEFRDPERNGDGTDVSVESHGDAAASTA